MTERVVIYTDGACKGNPGPGGWGAWVRWEGHEQPPNLSLRARPPEGDESSGQATLTHEKELFGGEPMTTNNRMEMTAVIEALGSLSRRMPVALYTDSEYVKNGITTWIHGWKQRGWKTANKQPVKNMDLWQRMDALVAQHDVVWHWVRGHTGDPGNERADALANRGVASLLL